MERGRCGQFRVDEEMIGTGLGKGGEMAFRLDDHQMHVERLLRAAAHRLHDQRPDRDIRHEAAVHDVDMNPVGAGRLDGANFIGKMSEVRRQDRRRNDNRPLPFYAGQGCPAGHCISARAAGDAFS